MSGEHPYNGETEETIEAFRRLYLLQKHEVSWAQHPPSIFTNRFLDEVSERSVSPLVYDLGCGEGSKTFILAREDFRVIGIDAAPEGISLAKERAEILGLSSKVSFICYNLLDIDHTQYATAEGVHIYQCVTHIPRKHHQAVASLIGSLVIPGGKLLTNDFSRKTTDFNGEDISQAGSGEFEGSGNIAGMRCYFFTEKELVDMYSPYFVVDELRQTNHPTIEGRFHWELLMTRRAT